MQETGTLLKNERESQGLTIAEVSRLLKINPKTIEKIESGNSEAIPGRPFVRGFVKSYARLLKLDENMVLSLLDSELGGSGKNQDLRDKTDDQGSWFRKVKTAKNKKSKKFLYGTILSLLLAAAFASYAYKQNISPLTSSNTANETLPELPTETPEELKPQMPTDNEDAKKDTKKKEPKNEANKEKSSKATNPKVKFIEPLSGGTVGFAKTIKVNPAPLASNQLESFSDIKKKFLEASGTKVKKAKEPVKKIIKDPVKALPEKIFRKAPVIFKHELRLYAANPLNIKFKIDNDIVRNISLRKGQSHNLKAFNKVWISVDDAGSLNIVNNKKDLGAAGEPGETKEITFDE